MKIAIDMAMQNNGTKKTKKTKNPKINIDVSVAV
jgi:hypothetical protein